MREILFRAKYKHDKWAYGHYVKLWDTHCINLGKENACYNMDISIETLGQYTGLTDKNGTKIFEGDIIKANSNIYGSPFFDGIIGKVVYAECSFFIEPKNPIDSQYLFADECAEIEIIGNVYDNPELLEAPV
jgi:uncharacterized phage protein (TIGR01671 family)